MLVKEDGQTLPEMEQLSDDEGQEARHRVVAFDVCGWRQGGGVLSSLPN